MDLRILLVEDSTEWRENVTKFFDGDQILGYNLQITSEATFEAGRERLSADTYDIVILDLYQGEPKDGNPKTGLEILKEIQKTLFVPVIFFTGLTKDIEELASEIVGVVNKVDGLGELKGQIEKTISSKTAFLRQQIFKHIDECLRSYFWDTVHSENKIFAPGKIDVSLGYLLLRRIANSLSKENIKNILGDETIKVDKAHPMEFYIFPPGNDEFEAGEILKKDDQTFVILTPSCDFVRGGERGRKAEQVLLCVATQLTETAEYKKFEQNREKSESLKLLIESRKGDRYFFLPGTPFLANMVLDFQNTSLVAFSDLDKYEKVAKLDDPFAQAMITSFTRYYNRVGYPDIDAEHIIENL